MGVISLPAFAFALKSKKTASKRRSRITPIRFYLFIVIFCTYIVEVENPTHCDFVKLRTMLITHMQDLQEVTNDVHYENYR